MLTATFYRPALAYCTLIEIDRTVRAYYIIPLQVRPGTAIIVAIVLHVSTAVQAYTMTCTSLAYFT